MRVEHGDGLEVDEIVALSDLPYVDVSLWLETKYQTGSVQSPERQAHLVVPRYQGPSITRYTHAPNRHILRRYLLGRARVNQYYNTQSVRLQNATLTSS